jgi:ferredoxin-NADP reductase
MSIVKKYPSKVISIQSQVDGLYSVELESLDGSFKYSPGQFLHLALDNYDGAGQWPESRCFSMQSNPDERTIRITYAVKGRFTKMMEQQLKIGSEVWMKLPYGDLFSRPHNKVNTVFIAGGTGITPFLSLFSHRSFSEYTNPHIYLGFRSQQFNIYRKELTFVKLSEPKIFYEDSEGQLNIHDIVTQNGPDSDYFISGPPEMIKNFKRILLKYNLSAARIYTDDWE